MHPAVSSYLAANYALVTAGQLHTLGLTRRQIDGMVRRGELVRTHHGVDRSPAVPLTSELRSRAGVLAAGERAVLSHRSAIAWHGARRFRCDLVEITNRASSQPRRDGLVVHRSNGLDLRDVERRRGLLVTTTARSLIDVATVVDPRLATRWAQEWIADRKLRIADLHTAIDRAGNHRGARLLGSSMEELIDDVDSPAEAVLGALLREAGLPPELHLLVTTQHGHTFELDWAYPDVQVGLELDGYGVHLRSATAFDDDRWRRNELTIAGWTILNFTTRQCRRPGYVVDQVRRTLVVSRKSPER